MQLCAGLDEAGRGPLAGPVSAACVILDPHFDLSILKDSKVLSEKKCYKIETSYSLCYYRNINIEQNAKK